MKNILKNRDSLILAIIGLALIVNWFFFWHKVGISFLIFSAIWIFLFEVIKWVYLEDYRLNKFHLFIIPILFFASVFVFRVNMFVLFLAGFMYWLNVIPYLFLSTVPNFLQRVSDMEILKMFGRLIISFGNIFNIPQSSKKMEGELVKKIIIAFAVTIPMITIVTLLLASADKIFSDMIKNISDVIIPDISLVNVFSFILALIISYLGISYVLGLIRYSNLKIVRTINDFKNHTDLIIPSILTYSLNIIYLLFVYVQFKYLFGGHEYAASADIVYSEYAIKGFWEMIVVCMINFGILYFLIGKFSLTSKKAKGLMIPSYLLTVFSSLVMVYSSHARLALYESGYGFSVDRLIPHSFLVFIIMILGLLTATLAFKDNFRTKILILGTFMITNIFIAGFTIFPMEKFIVRQNINRANHGKELDEKYLIMDLGLEGFNEVLSQIEKGNLEKELLMRIHTEGLIRVELDKKYGEENLSNGEYVFYDDRSYISDQEYTKLNSKITRNQKYKNHNWQSWNIEYAQFKTKSKEMLGNKRLCENAELTCNMI